MRSKCVSAQHTSILEKQPKIWNWIIIWVWLTTIPLHATSIQISERRPQEDISFFARRKVLSVRGLGQERAVVVVWFWPDQQHFQLTMRCWFVDMVWSTYWWAMKCFIVCLSNTYMDLVCWSTVSFRQAICNSKVSNPIEFSRISSSKTGPIVSVESVRSHIFMWSLAHRQHVSTPRFLRIWW